MDNLARHRRGTKHLSRRSVAPPKNRQLTGGRVTLFFRRYSHAAKPAFVFRQSFLYFIHEPLTERFPHE